MMELEQLLEKMANGEKLNPLERKELREEARALTNVKNLAQSWVVGGTSIPIFQSPIIEIYSKVLAVDTASVTISPIPVEYNHLMIVGNGRSTQASGADNILCQFNSDTAANYDIETMNRLNNVAGGTQNLALTAVVIGTFAAANADANASGNCFAIIPNYRSGFFKGSSAFGGGYFSAAAGAIVFTSFGAHESTDIIRSITLVPEFGSFVAGTALSVYGWR